MAVPVEVTDVDQLYERAIKAGCAPLISLEERWYRQKHSSVGNRQFVIEDPDGYLLRFFQSLGTRPL
jgi:uncharacterized glyoxalase superfamily protein PhnB